MLFGRNQKKVKSYEKGKVKFIFSFRLNDFSYASIAFFLDKILSVIDIDFRYHLSRGSYSLNNEERFPDLPIEFNFESTEESLHIGTPFHFRNPPLQFHLDLEMENAKKLLESDFIDSVFLNYSCISVFAINSTYFHLQKALQIERFKYMNVPLDGVKMIKNQHGKEIDVKNNPGHSFVIADTWLMAGWKMWFNNDFFYNLLGRDIYEFPYALDKKKNDKYTFIQLYENQDEPNFKENRKVQILFKEWVDFSKLLKEDRKKGGVE